jgi:hypothetical protein
MAQPNATGSEHDQDWIEQVRARGLDGALRLTLDVLEPVGPLGAQLLWFVQPVSGLFGWQHVLGTIAEALEEPGGMARLRRQLEQGSER